MIYDFFVKNAKGYFEFTQEKLDLVYFCAQNEAQLHSVLHFESLTKTKFELDRDNDFSISHTLLKKWSNS